MKYTLRPEDVACAREALSDVIATTPLIDTHNLSERYGATVLLKREDLQKVRSYKIRGAYNKIASLSADELARGVVLRQRGQPRPGSGLLVRAVRRARHNLHASHYAQAKTATGALLRARQH